MMAQQAQPVRDAPILIISHDVVGSHMAGPGIRVWEFARVLAQQQRVTLIAPQPIDIVGAAFQCGSYIWGDATSLAPWIADAGVVVANGYVLQAHPELATIRQPLALDLYDPVLLENLELFRTASEAQRNTQNQRDVALLSSQLASGDFFLCATERQRHLYLGALMAAGRITPAATDRDPLLRNLIDVVSFGLPATPPVQQQPALRGVVPGIGPDDLIVLWAGGLWDWLDPLTVIRALPQVAAQHASVRVVFLAGQHPGNVAAMQMPDAAKQLAQALGLLDQHVFFYEEWVPYNRRADFLLEADIAISLHRNHLETTYAAVRSRFLDHLWAGLPSIVSDGDSAADLVRSHALGQVVPPQDVDGVARALIQLLGDDDERRRCQEQARRLAAEFEWERVLQPLLAFCRRPRTMREQTHENTRGFFGTDDLNATRDAALARLDQIWQVQPHELTSQLPLVGQVKQLGNTLTRWYVQTIVEQQNAFNAAVVQALHQLAEASDRRYSNSLEHIGQLERSLQMLSRQLTELQAHVGSIDMHLGDIDVHLGDIDVHLGDIDHIQLAMARQLGDPERQHGEAH